MAYKIIPYSPSYLASLTQLLGTTFGITAPHKSTAIDWKYHHPLLPHPAIIHLALDHQDQVIGHYANLPITINQSTTYYKTAICTDMCTSPSHRGQGLISRLATATYRQVHAQRYDFTIGFSNHSGIKVDKYARNYGYHICATFQVYFKPIILPPQTDFSLHPTSIFQSLPDPSTANQHFLHITKDRNYLNWRYIHKPYHDYQIFRLEKQQHTTSYAILKLQKRTCYLHDLILPDYSPDCVQQALQAIEKYLYQHRIFILLINISYNSYWHNLLTKAHYLPIPYFSTSRYLTIKIHNPQLLKHTPILDPQSWWLINGDIL
jgi:GNAT superfamily N-acetyltransferase